ncbi:MAG: hypothetical protein A2Y56_15680 [Candidatus Aminicenantes bacterium RBG_13_63_10]|nr:MAG: hypothetical protein A2Y56_15680 [Candidatus Aminicenantes bacterium RBG_13_63_10]
MIAVIVCLGIMLILQVLTPFWWWIMLVPFAYGAAAARSGRRALWTGFLSAGLLWLGAGLHFYFSGSRIIAGRMARMIGLGRPWLLVAAAALVAALAAAVSGYAGWAVRSALARKKA